MPADLLRLAVLTGALVTATAGPAAAAGPGTAAVGSAGGDPAGARPLFTFTDRAITESSGLVDTGRLVYTVNDSGAEPVLYAVDPGSGRTVGTTTFAAGEVVDPEALAPGPRGTVWVGDIGDNLRRRPAVTVYRVRPGGGPVRGLPLTYPDGPRDAETLLAHPRTGRLFVVSKTVFGGVVYAAPRRLSPEGPNRMRVVARVPGLLTDGAFLPDGRHVLLRGYASAALVTFPDFGVVTTFALPPQDQGEAISVSPAGRVLLSSEGIRGDVLRLRPPPRVASALAGDPSPPATADPGPGRPSVPPAPAGEAPAEGGSGLPGLGGIGPGLGAVLAVALVAVLVAAPAVLAGLRLRRRRGMDR